MKHPGLLRLGADIAKELDREIGLRFDSERVSGPVPRVVDLRERRAQALPTPKAARSRRAVMLGALGALGVAAAFALGMGLSQLRRSTPEGAATSPSDVAFTYASTDPDGASTVPALGAPVSESGRATALAFSDGSRVSLEPKAEARVLRTTSHGATVLLERGRLAASVVHRANTEWAFDAGPYEVRVVGTAFDLAWDPRHDALTLHMTEGQVTVTGCGTSQSVGAGQDLTVGCNMESAPFLPNPNAVPSGPETKLPPASPDPSPSPSTSTSPFTSPSTSPFPPTSTDPAPSTPPPPVSPLEAMDAATLWTTADTARASGDAATAKTSLLVFRRRFKGDPRAATAAFLLGTLAYDVEHAKAEGLGWFSIYLAENPDGALSREALGRALEASIALDKPDDAQRLARRYLDTHRGGPHTELATRVLGGRP